jgi:hypothetical protein
VNIAPGGGRFPIERRSDAVSGVLYEPGQAPALAGLDPAMARIGIGGPLDGKVIRSNSTRLDWRQPTITITTDIDTGRPLDASVEAPTVMTYVPKTITVLGVRSYRTWVGEEWWDEIQTPTEGRPFLLKEFEAEVLLRLIDADPRDCRACRQLP